MDGLYLLCIWPRYKHAGHYLGYSSSIWLRIWQHVRCEPSGSPLIRAAMRAGCTVTLARTFPGEGRTRERQLKVSGHLSQLCPICRAQRWAR